METTKELTLAKEELSEVAKMVKKTWKNDKPRTRKIINDFCDYLCKSYDFSEHQQILLHNYACKLHKI